MTGYRKIGHDEEEDLIGAIIAQHQEFRIKETIVFPLPCGEIRDPRNASVMVSVLFEKKLIPLCSPLQIYSVTRAYRAAGDGERECNFRCW